jgi:tol-pal system protein YbgF
VCIALSACATKSDVRKLQFDIATLRARQDSVAREQARQSRMLQDSLREMSEFAHYMQGNVTTQIKSLQDLTLQVQALLGQSQQRIADLREQLDRQQQQQQQATQPVNSGGASEDDLYNTGVSKVNESPAVARAAFQELMRSYPNSPRLPDAQAYLAETYVVERDTASAFREFERVAELYPSAPKAAEALFRAGVVAEENRARARARAFYNRVVKDFPSSPVAAEARRRVAALR